MGVRQPPSDDDKVRASHAANDDQIFSWANPPETGHPGQGYNCRCTAEPVVNEINDPPIESIPIEQYVFILGSIRALAGVIIRDVARKLAARLKPKPNVSQRPEGVPEHWVRTPTKNKQGSVYTDPASNGATYVKVQKGNPDASQPGQRYDNVRWTKDGKSLDVGGNIVPKNSLESHIPLEDFVFKPELFK